MATTPRVGARLAEFRGPLNGRYPAAVALVLLALTPYLVLSTAFRPVEQLIGKDVGLGSTGLALTTAMSNAAYAFGTVLALQLTVRLPVRRVLLASSSLFVVASVLFAWAPFAGLLIAGHVLQGLATGLMLISAVPPLVIGWPKEKLRYTGVAMNLGLFGAVALGPVVGGVSAGAGAWRPMAWIVAGLGLAALAFALLTYEDQDPTDSDAPIDIVVLLLSAGGCAASFFGVAELQAHGFLSVLFLLPVIAGLLMIVAALVHQFRERDPLMPVEKLCTTLPVAGITVALTAGAGSIALVSLIEAAAAGHIGPTHLGMLFWPEFAAAVVAALVFGRLFLTRHSPVYAIVGIVVLAGGAAVLTGLGGGGDDVLILVGSGMLGFGVGASVAPGLFIAGFSLPSPQLARIFAMVELLRAEAAFLTAPVLVHIAMTTSGGVPTAVWATLGLVLVGGAAGVAVYLAGGARPHDPRADAWLSGDDSALDSPPLGAAYGRLRP